MHEFSLVSSVMEYVVKTAEAHGNRPVEKVSLEIGALQHVATEALTFAFDALKKDTVAENAVLEWRITPACIRCSSCATEYEPSDAFWVCPSCGAMGGHPIRGEEFLLESIEITDEPSSDTPA
ncbi:MAG TPA: hydrogenase maturation nickel metallochaperone HypA [Candidatus Hydrogenedentes bacterium]|nr:hydrogenase maturation nickel metallochaperone HypA [Candidatus Hydrogenedentota bacterium]